MNAALTATTSDRTTQTPAWRRTLVLLAANVAIWSALSAVGALTSLNDDLREGLHGSYWLIFLTWGRTSIALAILSFILYSVVSRWPGIVSNARNIALGYGGMLLCLLPFQFLFLGKLYLNEDGPGLTWAAVEREIAALDEIGSLLRLSSISAVYFAVVVLKMWQQSQQRAQAWAQAQADRLALSLELERQRGLALRAQLEPHFLFNALNAISALVRADDKDVVLTGIQRLSELLRYALAVGEHDRVKLSDELAFVDDYLSLQRLRYGDRLRIVIEGRGREELDCDVPPLLLQPLVENALRHDLDCHDEHGDIRLEFDLVDGKLRIRISNPVRDEIPDNPGAGLGLPNTRARLQLAYGDAASLRTAVVDGRFEVDIRLPAHAED
jgi:two-component system, LytTR family, sensor histidine kinase AlgZ